MSTYTVHAPPPKRGETASASERLTSERFVFVRDGFHFWAFLLAPLWLMAYRLWLALVMYIVVSGAITVSAAVIGASAWAKFFVWLLLALLVGFEASTLRRWTLARRGWKTLGFVVGDDQENAERRFFTEWTGRAAPPASALEPQHLTPVRRRPPSGHDVIGLFPEPEV